MNIIMYIWDSNGDIGYKYADGYGDRHGPVGYDNGTYSDHKFQFDAKADE